MPSSSGPERPVVFFDVQADDLVRPGEVPSFFWVADGLFFVIDPDHLSFSRVGDAAFDSVLDVVRARQRPESVSAAIILGKADKVKFDDPSARWLRADGRPLDAAEILAEGADVYAYLQAATRAR